MVLLFVVDGQMPAAINFSAKAKPIPEVPPVIKIVLFEICIYFFYRVKNLQF